MTQPTKWTVRTTKTHSSLCVQWVAKDPWFLHADSKDPDQTGKISGQTDLVFAGHTGHFVGFVMLWLK